MVLQLLKMILHLSGLFSVKDCQYLLFNDLMKIFLSLKQVLAMCQFLYHKLPSYWLQLKVLSSWYCMQLLGIQKIYTLLLRFMYS